MAAKKKEVAEAAVAVSAEETEEKASAKKTTKKAPAKKTEPPVKETEEKAEAAKKAPAKKAAVKKEAAKDEPKATVTIQFQGKDIVAVEVLEKAKASFAQISPDTEIKTIDVYVKPEEGVAYYAVNGEGSEEYKVEL